MCVYFYNDILFVFMIVVATMDQNANILRVIGHLRDIGSPRRGGDEWCLSLLASLLTIVDSINRLNDTLYNIASYRERKRQEYAHGLSYKEIKKIKISKEHIYTLFRVPGVDDIPKRNRPHISIDHIFPLSGASVNQLETIGWKDHKWFFILPSRTTRKYHCNSSINFIRSL